MCEIVESAQDEAEPRKVSIGIVRVGKENGMFSLYSLLGSLDYRLRAAAAGYRVAS